MRRQIDDTLIKNKGIEKSRNLTLKMIKDIRRDVILTIHGHTCYLLNFCGLTRKEASAMADHYNAILDIVESYRKDIEDTFSNMEKEVNA